MRTITGHTKAWLTEYGNPEALTKENVNAVNCVAYANHDMSTAGWTYVGEATITFECVDDDTLIQNKVAALRGELQTLRANTEIKSSELEQKIQKLLAIEFTPEVQA